MVFDQKHLDDQLAQLPKDASNAMMLAVDNNGMKFSVLLHKDKFWEARVIYEHSWPGSNNLAGEVIFHW
jgi:uncharacterized GH25 family protein